MCFALLFCFSDFKRLFEQLSTVQGNPKVQSEFVKDIIHEARRFKRHSLISELEVFLHKMGNRNNNRSHNNKDSVSIGLS